MDFLSLCSPAPHDKSCWDIRSNKSFTHGGGDSNGLINGIGYIITTEKAVRSIRDRLHVWCDVTNVISAIYPDVITAGSAYFGEQLVA
jgi:acetylxylan esterase